MHIIFYRINIYQSNISLLFQVNFLKENNRCYNSNENSNDVIFQYLHSKSCMARGEKTFPG